MRCSIEPRAVDLHAALESCRGGLRRRGHVEGEGGALSCLVEMKVFRGREILQPFGTSNCTVPETPARAAVSSTVTGRSAPGANSSHARHEPERDRRNDLQSAARGRVPGIRGLHRLARNHQGLPADFEDVLDRECGRVLRTPDERRIVDVKQARRALACAANTAGLAAWWRAGSGYRHGRAVGRGAGRGPC